MIKPQELRIGNYVLGDTGILNIVTAEGIYNYSKVEPCWSGIPLTEEWLLRFGWKKSGNKYFNQEYFISIGNDKAIFDDEFYYQEYFISIGNDKAIFDDEFYYQEYFISIGNDKAIFDDEFYYQEYFISIGNDKAIFDDEFYGVKRGIRYVHQLQNLYFALTGGELQLKEVAA